MSPSERGASRALGVRASQADSLRLTRWGGESCQWQLARTSSVEIYDFTSEVSGPRNVASPLL